MEVAEVPDWSSPIERWNEAPSLMEAALAYADAGIPVFPLEERGKAPLVPRGLYAATCDPEQIRHWWRRFPRANIGMPTGRPSGCWVLDIDRRHDGFTSLELLGRHALEKGWVREDQQAWHTTRVQLTGGGGAHLCYGLRRDLDMHFSNAVRFAGYPGLDLRVAGGYVVVAPSCHRSGERYRWLNTLPLLPFPDVLVDAWRAYRQRAFVPPPASPSASPSSFAEHRTQREADPEYWLTRAVKYGRPGCRRAYGLFLAFHLIDDVGMALADAEGYLVRYAEQVPQIDHPFSVAEALDCLYGAAKVRGLLGVG